MINIYNIKKYSQNEIDWKNATREEKNAEMRRRMREAKGKLLQLTELLEERKKVLSLLMESSDKKSKQDLNRFYYLKEIFYDLDPKIRELNQYKKSLKLDELK